MLDIALKSVIIIGGDYLRRQRRHGGTRLGYKKNVYHALMMITQFGINMLVPIFLCSFLGIYIDRKLDTSFWMVLLFFVGALAGFRNVYVFARKIYNMKSERDIAHGRKAGREEEGSGNAGACGEDS